MEKQLYAFKNISISNNMIAIDFIKFIKFHEHGLNTKQRIVLCFTQNGGVYDNYERLIHDIDLYLFGKTVYNPYERERECNKILECILYIVSMYIENPNLDHSEFEHILSYSKHGEHEIYSLKGPRYVTDFKNNIIKSHYKYSLETRIAILIQRIYKYLFNDECKVFEKTKIKQTEKENNMNTGTIFFISRKKKNGDLYFVNKHDNKTQSIKLPDELKKVYNSQIKSYTGNKTEKCLVSKYTKDIIVSLFPEEKHRKMLLVSFYLLQIKSSFNHVSIDKDIFERFKLTDTKASYDKLYDILDLFHKLMLSKSAYKDMKRTFSLK